MLVSVVSTSVGTGVMVWPTSHVKAVGAVVSGAIVGSILSVKPSALRLSTSSSARC